MKSLALEVEIVAVAVPAAPVAEAGTAAFVSKGAVVYAPAMPKALIMIHPLLEAVAVMLFAERVELAIA